MAHGRHEPVEWHRMAYCTVCDWTYHQAEGGRRIDLAADEHTKKVVHTTVQSTHRTVYCTIRGCGQVRN
jgi:rubredoxin